MRIAICDDNPDDLARLRTLTAEAIRLHGLDAEVSAFDNPDALLDAAEDEPFDLYLLDVVMDMLTGLQVVDELRRFQPCPHTIFFSTSREYAYDAIQLDAITYVAKPYAKKTFFNAMNKAVGMLKEEERHYLTLGIEGHLHRFRASEIEFVTMTTTINYVLIQLEDGTTVNTRSSINAFAEAYRHMVPLVAVGRRLLVNPALVSALDENRVRFFSGHALEVPGRSLHALHDAILACSVA